MKGDSAGETYHPSFTYHGCRYVEVTGLESPSMALVQDSPAKQSDAAQRDSRVLCPNRTAGADLGVGCRSGHSTAMHNTSGQVRVAAQNRWVPCVSHLQTDMAKG